MEITITYKYNQYDKIIHRKREHKTQRFNVIQLILGLCPPTVSPIFLLSNDYNLITICNPLQLNITRRSYNLIIPYQIPNPKLFYTNF